MIFSIVGRCATTGKFGVALSGSDLSVGAICDGGVQSHVGVCLTQGRPSPGNNYLGIRLMRQGFSPEYVLSQLIANDSSSNYRQILILGPEGAGVAYTGTKCHPSATHRSDEDVLAGSDSDMQGCDAILHEAVNYFAKAREKALDERLLGSLEIANDIMQGWPTVEEEKIRSSALIIFGSKPYSDIDLRVDMHLNPVAELRRTYEEFKPYEAYYIDRGKSPRNAIPQREFADILDGKRQLKDVL